MVTKLQHPITRAKRLGKHLLITRIIGQNFFGNQNCGSRLLLAMIQRVYMMHWCNVSFTVLHQEIYCCMVYKQVAVIDLTVQRRNRYCYYSIFCGQRIYLRRLKIMQLFVCTNTVFLPLKFFFPVALNDQIRTVLFHQAVDSSQRGSALSFSIQVIQYASIDQIVINGNFVGSPPCLLPQIILYSNTITSVFQIHFISVSSCIK